MELEQKCLENKVLPRTTKPRWSASRSPRGPCPWWRTQIRYGREARHRCLKLEENDVNLLFFV